MNEAPKRTPDPDSFKLNPPEIALVAQLKNKEEQSFELLIRTHGGYLMAIVRRYLNKDADVQDCVQETFLKAFEKIDSFEGRSTIRSWLHRIAVNQALSRLRSISRHPETFLDDTKSLFDDQGMRVLTAAETSHSAEIDVTTKLELEEVRKIIEQLPESSRNLLLLRDVEGYSTEETASLLGMSVGSVKTGLHRARHTLKMKIES